MKRILLVEDERFALEDLRDSLLRLSPTLDIATARSGTEALEMLKTEPFDALFLDIELPGLGGLDLIRELGATAPPTVLVTGHLREAVEAFGLGVVDCLLKPVDENKLRQILEKLAAPPPATTASAAQVSPAGPRRILLEDGRRLWLVPLAEVQRFHQEGAHVRGYFAEGSGTIQASLQSLMELDASASFYPIDGFTLVNLAAITCLNRDLDGRLLVRMKDGTDLPLHKDYEAAFLALFSL